MALSQIKVSELEHCHKNDVQEIVQIKLGYDGNALVNMKGGNKFNLTWPGRLSC